MRTQLSLRVKHFIETIVGRVIFNHNKRTSFFERRGQIQTFSFKVKTHTQAHPSRFSLQFQRNDSPKTFFVSTFTCLSKRLAAYAISCENFHERLPRAGWSLNFFAP
jgi:hypothetical protein